MATLGLIIVCIIIALLLNEYPVFGILSLVILLMFAIEKGSHGELPLFSYVVEGLKVIFN
jgi:hypothetical protein